MSREKKILSDSLSTLIEKFSQHDIIAVMEKEYQSAPARLIPLSLIDDTSFIKEAVLPREVISYFASELKKKGFYNPLVVRQVKDRYELILGRKRFYGAKEAGILSVPAAITEVGDEEELLMLLADNRDQRESNIVEMALVCQALQKKYGYTQQTLADLSHQSRSQITNILRVLKLPSPVRKDLCLGNISYGHAKCIASLNQWQILEVVSQIKEKNLSVRETERIAQGYANENDYSPLEEGLALSFDASSVSIKKRSITFSFDTEEQKIEFLKRIDLA